MLREGVEILKHRRKGKPDVRYLYCDPDMTKMYWRKAIGGVKPAPEDRREMGIGFNGAPRMSTGSVVDSDDGSIASTASLVPIGSKSRRSSIMDNVRRLARRSSVAGGKSDTEREIAFKDISEVS